MTLTGILSQAGVLSKAGVVVVPLVSCRVAVVQSGEVGLVLMSAEVPSVAFGQCCELTTATLVVRSKTFRRVRSNDIQL